MDISYTYFCRRRLNIEDVKKREDEKQKQKELEDQKKIGLFEKKF